jgi:hypothetical protein
MAVLGASVAVPGASADDQQSLPKRPGRITLGESDVEQLLLLMDTDKNGRISKAEWMNFMSAEFDRLDTDHSGELDKKEIAQSRLEVTRLRNSGK